MEETVHGKDVDDASNTIGNLYIQFNSHRNITWYTFI